MIVTSKHLAFGMFLASTAMTGVSLALMQYWAVQQAVWTTVIGVGVMTAAAGVAFGQPGRSLDRRMARNRAFLRLSKRQIGPRLGPVTPPRHRNGHRGISELRYARSFRPDARKR